MANNENPWQYWLEDVPNALYQAMIPKGTPSFQNYWQRQQSKIMNEYEGALGKQALGGQPPSLGFGDFLSSYPWQSQWYSMSPASRGLNTGRFAPGVQWRF